MENFKTQKELDDELVKLEKSQTLRRLLNESDPFFKDDENESRFLLLENSITFYLIRDCLASKFKAAVNDSDLWDIDLDNEKLLKALRQTTVEFIEQNLHFNDAGEPLPYGPEKEAI